MNRLKIIDSPGKVPVATMRKLFEASVRDTKVFRERFKLEEHTEDGEFAGYKDASTDFAWLGFAIGLRTSQRVHRAEVIAGEPHYLGALERAAAGCKPVQPW